MNKTMEMIERVRDGEDARKVIRGLREGKDGESDEEGLRERTERFLAKNRKKGLIRER